VTLPVPLPLFQTVALQSNFSQQDAIHDSTTTIHVTVDGLVTVLADDAIVYHGAQDPSRLTAARFASILDGTVPSVAFEDLGFSGSVKAMISSFHTTASRVAVHYWPTTALQRRQLFENKPSFYQAMSGWQCVLQSAGTEWPSIARLELPPWARGIRLQIDVIGSPDPDAADGLLDLSVEAVSFDMTTLPAQGGSVELEAVVAEGQAVHLRYSPQGVGVDGTIITVVAVEYISAETQGSQLTMPNSLSLSVLTCFSCRSQRTV
jgi:hypothetical protein